MQLCSEQGRGRGGSAYVSLVTLLDKILRM